MITSDLIAYIKSELDKNISKDLIIANLSSVGWRIEDIEEGFLNIESIATRAFDKESSSFSAEKEKVVEQVNVESIENKKTIDPYREFPEGIDIEDIDPYKVLEKQEEKIESKPKQEVKEEGLEVSVKDSSIPEVKIWTPTTIKPKLDEVQEVKKEVEPIKFSTETKIENYSLELTEGKKASVSTTPFVNVEKVTETKEEDLIPLISKNNFPEISVKKEEVINSRPLPDMPLIKKMPSTVNSTPVNTMKDIVPKNAMISSYSQDILAASKEQEAPIKNRKSKLLKTGVFFIIVAIIGMMVFAFVEGYLKIPWSNLSIAVVKKDPKTFLMSAPKTIAKLDSYKVETKINISTPSLSSITTGLASGEAVTSRDRDSISVVTKGIANHTNGQLSFDYVADFNSSILQDNISSNLKYDGNKLFATVPDMKQILNENSPKVGIVSFTPDQISMIVDELSPSIQDVIKKVDVYNITSGKIPLYVKNKISLVFREFISGLTYVEKGKEEIHGVETYHYELTADRQSTKKLLVSLSDLFITSITDEQKKELEETLGSSSISAFDVWVGVNDDNIYQIKFTLNTPLSKVLGLNDSGIAGNEVKLDWTTTYYDLNVPNKIVVLNESISMEEFVKGVKDLKIKNIISSLTQQTKSFRNAIGSYGLRSNPTGSCTNPNPSSLFSPQGHKKGADTPVGNIASSMNSLLSVTSGAGYCYSTSTAWALAVPLASSTIDNPSFYCTDSTGNTTTISTPIKDTICK